MNGDPEQLLVQIRTDGPAVCVVLRGELCLAASPTVDRLLRDLPAGDVVLDVSDVTFCDSSGLSTLVGAHRRARLAGTAVTLRGPQGPLLRMLRMTGVDVLFDVEAADGAAHVADLPTGGAPA